MLNGSPKGKKSITYHHALFLEKHFKACTFEYEHIGLLYKKLNQDTYVEEIVSKIREADAVIFAYPVYTFSVPYQLMLFVEKLYDYKDSFDTYAIQLSTSKHFYDVTAYDYMARCLEDIGFKHINGHMADMNDLLEDHGRKQLVSFFTKAEFEMKNKVTPAKKYIPIKDMTVDYIHHPRGNKEKLPSKILVIYNGADYSDNLMQMINAFENIVSYEIHRLDLSNIKNKGGCIGCLKCAFSGHCIYKDDFEVIHRDKFQNSDIIIYASDIKNHWLHSDFKYLHDRAFYNGHRVDMGDKAIGYLIAGNLKQEHNLKMVLEARASVGHMHLLDIVTNEDEYILDHIERLSNQVDFFIRKRPLSGDSFYGIGGMKIFRDLVYSMRSVMLKDHQYYKKNKLYDFPKNRYVLNFFMTLGMKILTRPKFFNRYSVRMDQYIIQKYEQVIDKY